MKERIIANNSKKSGLCIRCLNKKNLQGVLDFLGPQSSAIAVCKYWRLCLKQCFGLLYWNIFGIMQYVKYSELETYFHIDYMDLVNWCTKRSRSVATLQERQHCSLESQIHDKECLGIVGDPNFPPRLQLGLLCWFFVSYILRLPLWSKNHCHIK